MGQKFTAEYAEGAEFAALLTIQKGLGVAQTPRLFIPAKSLTKMGGGFYLAGV